MTDYNKQATDFLKATNTTLEVKEAEKQTPPTWDESKDALKHIKYKVTLENKHHSYTFDFWGSIADYEKIDAVRNYQKLTMLQTGEDYRREKTLKENQLFAKVRQMKKEDKETYIKNSLTPTAYDILACLSPMYESTFDDWCSSYGYDVDSRKAYTIYMQCVEQDLNLRKLFDREELEKLLDIN